MEKQTLLESKIKESLCRGGGTKEGLYWSITMAPEHHDTDNKSA